MKILVLGGTGMAGHMIALYLQEAGHEVTVFGRKKVDYCKCLIGDVRNFGYVRGILDEGEYDAVINAIGLLTKTAEEQRPDAVLLNSFLPYFLCEATKDKKTRVIHMSTDCVFSGNTGGYTENSLMDGGAFYDRTKALGELYDKKNLTFRNSIIGPELKESGIGLFHWFMKQTGTVSGYTKAVWTGVTTLTLAKAMEQALLQNLTGLYHLVNNCTITKYELLVLFNKYMRNNTVTILEADSFVLDKSLINNRKDFSFLVPGYEEMIVELKEWMDSHRFLYAHYYV